MISPAYSVRKPDGSVEGGNSCAIQICLICGLCPTGVQGQSFWSGPGIRDEAPWSWRHFNSQCKRFRSLTADWKNLLIRSGQINIHIYYIVITWHTSGRRKKNVAERISLNAGRRYNCLHQTSDPDRTEVVVVKSKYSRRQAGYHTIIGCYKITEEFKFIPWCCRYHLDCSSSWPESASDPNRRNNKQKSTTSIVVQHDR